MNELIKIKKKYNYKLPKNLVKVGDSLILYKFKGKYRYIYTGIVLKKNINLFNYNIKIYNTIKKNKIIKLYNLFSKSIRFSLVTNNLFKLKRNNLNFFYKKYMKINANNNR